MPSTATKIWIHAFFSTKNRAPLIDSSFESRLHAHIKNHLECDLRCYLQAINGTQDHVHLLFLLNPNVAVKDVIKNIKGESSHWVNSGDFLNEKFAWQKAYTAISVSDPALTEIEQLITLQKDTHKDSTYVDEQQQFSTTNRLHIRFTND